MDLAMNQFVELDKNEIGAVNGGSITLATVLFVAFGVDVTVKMCLTAGAAVGLVAGGAVIIKG